MNIDEFRRQVAIPMENKRKANFIRVRPNPCENCTIPKCKAGHFGLPQDNCIILKSYYSNMVAYVSGATSVIGKNHYGSRE